jgi:UDP-N-acetylmuramyl pentapeptide phosphotransferase/UDP-N-acetylglucosamine-1-phosphate transferase
MVYLSTLVLSILLGIILRNFFIKKRILDKINHRSSHDVIATRTGGSVLFIILFIYIVFLYLNSYQPFDFSVIIPISILFVAGLYDDVYGVDYSLKFIFQIIAAKLLIDMGYIIDLFSVFGYEMMFSRSIAQILTIIFYLAVFNAYNFIDGIDGNIIFETIKSLILIIILFDLSTAVIELIIILIIIFLSILPFNLNKRFKVFMGDSGSLIIPIIIIFLLNQGLEFSYDQNILKYLAVVFIYPLFDLSRVTVLRISRGKSPFLADKNHIHHMVDRYFKNHIVSSSLIFIISGLIQVVLIYILLL